MSGSPVERLLPTNQPTHTHTPAYSAEEKGRWIEERDSGRAGTENSENTYANHLLAKICMQGEQLRKPNFLEDCSDC